MLPRAVPNNVKAPTAAVSVPDPAAYIRERLKLAPIPALPGIRLYLGQPESGLGRFTAEHNDGRPPYWAYPWSGGLALAQHLCAHPDKVRGKRVLDLGAGGGVVAITAAQAGAGPAMARVGWDYSPSLHTVFLPPLRARHAGWASLSTLWWKS